MIVKGKDWKYRDWKESREAKTPNKLPHFTKKPQTLLFENTSDQILTALADYIILHFLTPC